MTNLTPELREKFRRFRKAYEHELARLVAAEIKGSTLAKLPYQRALLEVPLSPEELLFYKKLVALHSVNGGELFGSDESQ